MDMLVFILVGTLLLALGYFIGVRQKINLVHSYHHRKVAQQDRPRFCKRVGLGNAIIGGAILSIPVLRPLIGENAALAIAGIAAVAAGILVFATIIKYNHGLF